MSTVHRSWTRHLTQFHGEYLHRFEYCREGLTATDAHGFEVWADSAVRISTVTPHTRFEADLYALQTKEGGRAKPFFSGYRPSSSSEQPMSMAPSSSHPARRWSCRGTRSE